AQRDHPVASRAAQGPGSVYAPVHPTGPRSVPRCVGHRGHRGPNRDELGHGQSTHPPGRPERERRELSWAGARHGPGPRGAGRGVAMEYLAAAHGLEFLQPLRPGVGPRAAYARIRGSIPRLVDDRSLAGDVDRILGWMKDGALVAAAEAASGGLS